MSPTSLRAALFLVSIVVGGCGEETYSAPPPLPPPPPQAPPPIAAEPVADVQPAPPPPPSTTPPVQVTGGEVPSAPPPPPPQAPQSAPAPPADTEEAPPPAQWVYSYPQGQWVYASDRGWMWIPSGTETVDTEGMPYAYLYTPAYGWTWYVSPWGWGPYHYGAWVRQPWHPVGWRGGWVAHPRVVVHLGAGGHRR